MSENVRIYQPAKNAMQSGRGRTKVWVLEYEQAAPRRPEPLMGWVSAADTQSQVKLTFSSKEDALAYAERKGLKPTVLDPNPPALRLKSYADNFRPDRIRY